MKTLYLVRHAKSSWDDSSLSDFDRPLNQRGEHDAPIMAKVLKDEKVKPDLIISSPAIRALTTAKVFAEKFHYDESNILEDKRVYEATMRELTSVVQEISNDVKCAILFGHNPGISNFVNLLGDKLITGMPTCAIAGIELKIQSWKDLERHCGKITLFEYPKKH